MAYVIVISAESGGLGWPSTA